MKIMFPANMAHPVHSAILPIGELLLYLSDLCVYERFQFVDPE